MVLSGMEEKNWSTIEMLAKLKAAMTSHDFQREVLNEIIYIVSPQVQRRLDEYTYMMGKCGWDLAFFWDAHSQLFRLEALREVDGEKNDYHVCVSSLKGTPGLLDWVADKMERLLSMPRLDINKARLKFLYMRAYSRSPAFLYKCE